MTTSQISRPCKYCGEQVTAADLTYQVCRHCYYNGTPHNEIFADLISDLVAVTPDETTISCEHTGGGCWWLAVRLPSGGYFAGTESYKNTRGEWDTDGTLPDTANGPWGIGYYQDAECEGILVAEGVSGEHFVEIVRRGEVAKVGQRVRLKHSVERFPHVFAEAGTTGTVEHVSPDLITVKLDQHVPSLAEWDNCICFERGDGGVGWNEFFAGAEVAA